MLPAVVDAMRVNDQKRRSEAETITEPAFPVGEEEANRRLFARTGLRARQMVHDWCRNGRDRRLTRHRARLCVPRGRAASQSTLFAGGVDRVVGMFDDGHPVWARLTTPRLSLEGSGAARAFRAGQSRAWRRSGRLCVRRGYNPDWLRTQLRRARLEPVFRVVHHQHCEPSHSKSRLEIIMVLSQTTPAQCSRVAVSERDT